MIASDKLIRKILRKSTPSIPYEVLLWLGSHQDEHITYQSLLARYLRRPVTTINYWITKFKQEGLIKDNLTLTDNGWKLFRYVWENVDKTQLRAHNIQVKFNIDYCPRGYPGNLSKSIYQPLTNKRYKGIKTELNGFTTMFYSPRKIVCVIPDIYGDTDEEISAAIQVQIPLLKDILQKEFEGVRIGTYKLAIIQTMHVAVLDSIIARTRLLTGFTTEDKEYAIDNSHEIPELELTNPEKALANIGIVLNLDKHIRKLTQEEAVVKT